MTRPIDRAMAEDRPAKAAVRSRWIEEVKSHTRGQSGTEMPIYLCLPGSEGKDIESLIDSGVIRTTETGGIQADDAWKVVAVEKDNEAVLTLQRKFPGLKILQRSLTDLLQGSNEHSWPGRKDRRHFRAKVINLDFDIALKLQTGRSRPTCEELKLAKKISSLQNSGSGDGQAASWSLCLTFNSTVNWNTEIYQKVLDFLQGNCDQVEEFADGFAALLGSDLIHDLLSGKINHKKLEPETNHLLVSILLTKLVICEINDHGWTVEEIECWRYGQMPASAPMVMTLLRLTRNHQGTNPAQVYNLNVGKIPNACAFVDKDGQVLEDLQEST